MFNCNITNGVICNAAKGQSIENFAAELIALRKEKMGVIVGIFNDYALFVHSQDTACDIVKRYNNR